MMKIYQGDRTEFGCRVTVDGVTLPLRSDLTGVRTTTLEWGSPAGRQLSLALLCNLLGNDEQAMRLCETFNQKFIAHLPYDSWTLTDDDLARALASVDARYRYSRSTARKRLERSQATPVSESNRNTPEPLNEVPTGAPSEASESAPIPAAPVVQINRAAVARLAYRIWEINGKCSGRALEDWLTAEARLQSKR